MKAILIVSLAFVVAAAPALAAAVHLIGPPVVAHDHEDDDCGDHEDDDSSDDGARAQDDNDEDDDCPPATTGRFVVESALLNGLEGNTLFPFIDTTPNNITRAHIAIADGTETCAATDGTAPLNIEVLVGVAGGTLVNVMTAATNTGIGNSRQCVFHVTIVPGADGVPSQVTDIVVKNVGEAPLTGVNTITVSAEVA